MKLNIFRWVLFLLAVGTALLFAFAVAAGSLEIKEFAEGNGASDTGSVVQGGAEKNYVEGAADTAAGSRISEQDVGRSYPEGQGGPAGRASFPDGDAWTALSPAADLVEIYRFSGVSDDGEQGSASRREATSIHCTNVSASDNEVEVQVYQWNGTDVFTGTVTMPPNRTFTFSTQNTTIYFDDVILGGVPGTEAIFQGSGVVLAESSQVVCSVQVLDPLNYPPVFAVSLEVYKR